MIFINKYKQAIHAYVLVENIFENIELIRTLFIRCNFSTSCVLVDSYLCIYVCTCAHLCVDIEERG